VETAGGGWYFRSLVCSKPSFPFNTRRSSGIERSRAASNDMMVDGENTEAHCGAHSYRVHYKQFPDAHFVASPTPNSDTTISWPTTPDRVRRIPTDKLLEYPRGCEVRVVECPHPPHKKNHAFFATSTNGSYTSPETDYRKLRT